MNIKNLSKQIVKLGGTATITKSNVRDIEHLNGRLGKYTIEFSTNDSRVFTALKDNTAYDMGSDYNPAGYRFCERIKDLQYLI